MTLKKSAPALILVFLLAGLQSCATLNQIAGALLNLQRLQFKLGQVHGFAIAGVRLDGKAALSDFSVADGFRLVQAFSARRLPVEFVLDVLAVNPNDGTGGFKQTVSTLTGLESRLLIDGKPTVTGNIDRPVDIPGTGRQSTIAIRLGLDFYEFFGQGGYDQLIALALAIGGRHGSPARLSLDALPTVTTPIGPITYPNRITIVDREFR
jgi:hypothetical protein